jgi:hypothetical protein
MVRYVPGHSLLSDFGYPIGAIRTPECSILLLL